jgi:hypothetical protein
MERLRFLQMFGLALGGGALLRNPDELAGGPANPPPSAASRFRVGQTGQILVSPDAGTTWEVHANFGPRCEVLSVREQADGARATLRHKGAHVFQLRLDPSGQHWLA